MRPSAALRVASALTGIASMYEEEGVSLLIGKTIVIAQENESRDEIIFVCASGDAFRAYHMQDCCESVTIHDVRGELSDLIGSPITEATEDVDSKDWPDDVPEPAYQPDSFTWTTHRFRTESGREVVVRWYGESNGWYSESVYFQRTHKPLSAA